MPTVPQIPLPKKQQVEPGQETASNISEMKGSFRAAAAESSNRIMKRTFASLFSAIRFKEKQENNDAETRKSYRNVSDALESTNDSVDESVDILQEINFIQFRSLGLLRDIVIGIKKQNSTSMLGEMPKTLVNLLKIAGLAGVLLVGGAGIAIAKALLEDDKNTENLKEDSVSKNIQEKEPLSQDALSPKQDKPQADGKQEKGDNDESPELTKLAKDFEDYVIGGEKENKLTDSAEKTEPSEQLKSGDLSVNLNKISNNSSTGSTSNYSNISRTDIDEKNYNFVGFASPVGKQDISQTITGAQQDGAADLRENNKLDNTNKLTRSLVFTADSITFSADEIEFIQKKIENVKSEEIKKISEGGEEDYHARPGGGGEASSSGVDAMGNPTGMGTTPGGKEGPAGSNPGNSSTPFNGQLNPELGQVKTQSGLTTQVAKDMVPKFQGFITDLEATGYKIRELGGYANRRNVNDPSKWSAHAYGAAIDINPSSNPNQTRQTDMPRDKVQNLIQKHGLGWGLNWNSVGDPMHFSAMPNEGGTGSPTNTMTPEQPVNGGTPSDVTGGSGGGTTGGSGGSGGTSESGGTSGGGNAPDASSVSREPATPGSGISQASSSSPSTPSSSSSAPTPTPEPSTPPPAIPTPAPISTGQNINTMSQSSSPLRPRPTMDQILNQIQTNQNSQNIDINQTNSQSIDANNPGNVEPPDASSRIMELFGDYSSFRNAGSLG